MSGKTDIIKFLGIMLCCLYSLYMVNCGRALRIMFKDRAVISAALFFTLLADSQLLYEGNYLLGICLFIIVQLIYLYRISCRHLYSYWESIIKSMPAALLVSVIIIAVIHPDICLAAAGIYITLFISNIIRLVKERKKDKIFLTGMLLFILCDINVGIYNLGSYIAVEGRGFLKMIEYSGFLMWFFYLPSQVLITLSPDYDYAK